jgi:hypothetical protein
MPTLDTYTILTTLEAAPGLLVPLIREMPAARLKQRPGPGKWSAHEHFCHLSTLHPMFLARLDSMLSDDNAEIVPYFPDEAEGDTLLDIDLDAAVERYVWERADFVARLKTLSDSDWQRTARHGEYSHYSVYIMCRHIAMHDLLHGYRIEELVLARE